MNDINIEDIMNAVSASNSFIDVLRNLKLEITNSNKKHIERKIKKFNISVEHFVSIKRLRESKDRYNNSEVLSKLVENNSTLKDVLNDLGLLAIDSNYKTLKKYLKKYKIDYSKFKNTKEKYKKDELTKVVLESNSYSDCLIKLDIRSAGGNYNNLKKYIELYDIDISHFSKKNYYLKSKIPLESVLIENSSYSRSSLKKRLYEDGFLEKKCSLCGQDENWNGMKISLILDHINGVHNDNRIENLRIVCPNCNAGLDTFAGKNNKNKKERYYCKCGDSKNRNSNKCNECRGLEKRKIERPNIDILMGDITNLGYVGTGKKYGVSDNAIRKWIKSETKHNASII
jgi:hypothetical protein